MGTYPNGILQRLRLLTKAVELVHGVWLMTREAYEHPLVGPRYWCVARDGKGEDDRALSPLAGRAQNVISTMMTNGWFLSTTPSRARKLIAGLVSRRRQHFRWPTVVPEFTTPVQRWNEKE